jgi:glycosyltransferase involved in cell wall biosynthesis
MQNIETNQQPKRSNLPSLNNKTILILSPQSWGKMMLSKHHYAIALARRGNKVFFLNPPDNYKWKLAGSKKRIRFEQLKEYPGLTLIWHRLFFPYNIKFHLRSIYNTLVKKQVHGILDRIGEPIDIVWSFDLGNLYPFSIFNNDVCKIFHPVDEPADQVAIQSATGADIIFSVTNEILEKYHQFPAPKHFINHGIAEEFLLPGAVSRSDVKAIQVGLSGNLLRPDLDRAMIVRIVEENPQVRFNMFGSYKASQSNIGDWDDPDTKKFIASLKSKPNVEFHGTVPSHELARALRRMDALLICYDINRDQSRGTNYHKVMEYLSTGKVIISNNITTYSKRPDLVRMIQSRDNNNELPVLLKETLTKLDVYNSAAAQQLRIDYARENTYSRQLDRIEALPCKTI